MLVLVAFGTELSDKITAAGSVPARLEASCTPTVQRPDTQKRAGSMEARAKPAGAFECHNG
jgi:hypothetical protein